MTDKQSLEDWAAHVKKITSSTAAAANETEAERTARISRLEADPEAWFVYYFPAYAFATPAPFHTAATRRVIQKKEHYEVRMWSRELAKSTRTMMEVLYLALVGHTYMDTDVINDRHQRLKKRYILLISNSLDNATRLLMPYKANLQCNDRIIQDYGRQESTGKWQAAEFTTESGIAFRALGAGQSPRGTRNEEVRPDILLFDDVDTDADCLNPEMVGKKWRWIEEAAIGTRSVSQPTTIIFCGNRIATDCCIERACSFADEVSIVNIRTPDGVSSWPQKNTEEDIVRVLKQKSYAATQKEYYNNPITEGAVFAEMAWQPARPINEYEQLVCYTDPSYTDNGDYKATVLVGRWKGQYHIIKCFLEQTTSASMIDWHFQIQEIAGKRCRYYMEHAFLQELIRKQLSDACAEQGINIHVQPDKRSKEEKFTRIEALLEPLNRNGKLFLNADEKYSPHMLRLQEQFGAFAYGGRAHDDGPDAVEGAVWILTDNRHTKDGKNIRSVGRKLRNNSLMPANRSHRRDVTDY